MGRVYLLQELDFDGQPTGLYKIGKTKVDVEKRKRQYKAGNPRPVVNLYSVEVDDEQFLETSLHRFYRDYRISEGGGDEWFYFGDIDINSVMNTMYKYSVNFNRIYGNYSGTGVVSDDYVYSNPPDLNEDFSSDDYDNSTEEGWRVEDWGIEDWGIGQYIHTLWIVLIGLLLVLMLAMQSPRAHFEPTVEGVPSQVLMSEGQLANLRSEPAFGENTVGRVNHGTDVVAYDLSQDGQWRFVELPDGSRGWIASNFVYP